MLHDILDAYCSLIFWFSYVSYKKMDITDLRLDFVSTGVFHNYLSKAVKACNNRKLQ